MSVQVALVTDTLLHSSMPGHVHHCCIMFVTTGSHCCDHHCTTRSCAYHCSSRSCAQHGTSRSCAQHCTSRCFSQHCTSCCCLPSRCDHHVVAVVLLWPFYGAIITASVRGWLCMVVDMKQKQSGVVSVCNRV